MYPLSIRCTYDKNFQPLVQDPAIALMFLVFAPGGQAKNQIGPKFSLWGQESFKSIAPVVTERTLLTDPDELWPLRPWKIGKSKTWVLCHVSLLDVPMIQIWRWSSHQFRSYSTLCVFSIGTMVAQGQNEGTGKHWKSTDLIQCLPKTRLTQKTNQWMSHWKTVG
jgi:hypothetical protein